MTIYMIMVVVCLALTFMNYGVMSTFGFRFRDEWKTFSIIEIFILFMCAVIPIMLMHSKC
jgi:hypothetical protein